MRNIIKKILKEEKDGFDWASHEDASDGTYIEKIRSQFGNFISHDTHMEKFIEFLSYLPIENQKSYISTMYDILDYLYDEGHYEGRDEGYTEGRDEGYTEGRDEGYTEGRDEGYTEGRDEGYDEGYEAGRDSKDCHEEEKDARQDGYDYGYDEGYEAGKDTCEECD